MLVADILTLDIKHLKLIIEETNKVEVFQINAQDQFEVDKMEQALDARNQSVLQLLMQEYWVGPLRKRLVNRYPYEDNIVLEIF